MFCCEKYTHIGCYSNCSCVDLDLLATQAGDYTFEYSYRHAGISFKQKLIGVQVGDDLRLPFTTNENSTFFFKILQPDGTYLEKDGNSCFCATININRIVGVSNLQTKCDSLPTGIGTLQLTQDLLIPNLGGVLMHIEFTAPPNFDYDYFEISIGHLRFNVDKNGLFYAPLEPGTYIIDVEIASQEAVFPFYNFAFTVI